MTGYYGCRHGVGQTCPGCDELVDRAEAAAGDREPDDGFDRDYNYPRDLAPKGA